MKAACEAFGIDAIGVEQEEEKKEFGVWPENQQAVEVFVRSRTQWKLLTSMSGQVFYAGLDYPAVRVLMEVSGMLRERTEEVFSDVQAMEMAALPMLNDAAPASSRS